MNFNEFLATVVIIIIMCSTIVVIKLKEHNKELEFVKAGLEQCETDRALLEKPTVIWVKDCIKYKQIKGN